MGDEYFTVRSATSRDAAGVAAVHVASIRGLAATHYTAEQIAAWSAGKEPSRYSEALADGEVMFVAIARAGAIIGFAARRDDELRAVYVDPDHARRGVGRRLLAAVERDALVAGVTALRLESSLNAAAFYRAHGYSELRRAAHPLRSGVPLECVVMRKPLVA